MTTVRQAGAVLIDGRAVLIEGPAGCGKTALALELIDRGAQLIGDDGVTLTLRDGHVWIGPPPNTAGLIEVRNAGLLTLPTASGPAALILFLASDAPRFIESAQTVDLLGHSIPRLYFDPDISAAAIRAEHALAMHGLD